MLDWTRPRPSVTVLHLLEVGQSFGVPPERLLADVDLTVEDLHTVGRHVMGLDEVAVVRALLRELPRVEYLGLLSATRSHTTSYGPVGFAFASAPTMRSIYETGRRFQSLTFGMTEVEFRFAEEWYSMIFVRHTLPNDVIDFYMQREIALPLIVANEVTDGPMRARSSLQQSPFVDPESYRLAEQIFGSVPEFNAEFASFSMPLTFLDTALPRHNAHTHAQMLQMAEVEQERILARSKITEAVRLKVLATLADGSRLEDVARQMLLSPRTLRRHLQDEGTTFRAIVDSVRVARAEHLLDTGVGVAQVASALGYENPSAFTTAFKRWHGMPPSQFAAARSATPPSP